MAFSTSSYSVSRSHGVCAATGRPFQLGDQYVATLVEREGASQLERIDFSIDAWGAGSRPEPPLRLFGFWRSVFQPGEAKRPEFLGDPELLELFEELAEAVEPKRQAFRYLLALLLVRRRVLRCIATNASGMSVLPKGVAMESTAIQVVDPGLDDQLIAEAMDQLSQIVPPDDAHERKG